MTLSNNEESSNEQLEALRQRGVRLGIIGVVLSILLILLNMHPVMVADGGIHRMAQYAFTGVGVMFLMLIAHKTWKIWTNRN